MEINQAEIFAINLEKYKEIIDSISDAVVSLDDKWRYTFINERAKRFLGKEASFPLLGCNIWDTFNEIIGQELKDACEKASSQQKYVYLEQYYSTYKIWIEIHIYPSATGFTIIFRDINARKKKEEEAQKESHRNTIIMDTMRENFMLSDEQMNIVEVNPSFCISIGYTREELLTMNVSDFYPGLEYEVVKKNFAETIESGKLLINTRIRKKNGELANVEVTHAKMYLDGNVFIATFGRDVTAFKKAEEEIKKSNHRFELIGDTTQDAVWEIEMGTGNLWANDTHQAMYGLEKSDPVPGSEKWRERIHPDGREQILLSLENAINEGKNKWLAEYWFRTENKGWIYIYDRTYIVRNDEGEPVSMLGSMLDITQLKEAEREIENEKKLSDSIINTLPGIFYLYDENGRFLRWNKNFETISKYSAEEIALMHPIHFYDTNEKVILRKKIAEVFEKGSAEVEADLFTKDKEKIPFYFTGMLTEIKGKRCLIGTGIEITEIKKAEAEVDAMKQEILNQKVQAQKKISRAIISTQEKERDHIGRELHDNVNQILAGARLYLIMAGKQNLLTKELVKYPMELLDSSISEIRLLTHKHATPPKDIDLKDLIKTLLDNLSKITGITTNLEYDISRNILDDGLKINLYRIVQEQINNITKHASPKNAEISITADSEMICLVIKDDGKGFDIYQQHEGIGISNIINRVDSFDGLVEIISEPGQGCILNIKIPYQFPNK